MVIKGPNTFFFKEGSKAFCLFFCYGTKAQVLAAQSAQLLVCVLSTVFLFSWKEILKIPPQNAAAKNSKCTGGLHLLHTYSCKSEKMGINLRYFQIFVTVTALPATGLNNTSLIGLFLIYCCHKSSQVVIRKKLFVNFLKQIFFSTKTNFICCWVFISLTQSFITKRFFL